MRKFSNKRSNVKALSQEALTHKVIDDEALLSLAMKEYAARVLHDSVERILGSTAGAQRWGTESGYVRAGMQNISIERPRVRGNDGEIPIPEYEKFQDARPFRQSVKAAIIGGLSTRSFARVGDAIGTAKGLSKSTISRVSKSFADDFQKLMEGDLADVKAVYIDGIHFSGEICIVAALGVNAFGGKRLVGLWAGTTETAELMRSMMSDLKNRNLNPNIFVIDGGKALKAGIERAYPWVAIQRCQVHKRRNIIDHVGPKHEAWAHIQMTNIFKANTVADAVRLSKVFAAELEKINVTAARSWLEAMPEVITVLQFADPALRRSLSSTNSIESFFSSIRVMTGRVRRWRNATQAIYWTAGGATRVQPNLKKIRGYRSLKDLDGLGKLGEDGQQLQKAA